MARKALSLGALMDPEERPDPTPAAAQPKNQDVVEKPAKAPKPSYREGKRAFTAWAPTEAYRQLKRMAADRDTTVQALLEEGMDLVFAKYGYDQIARQ